MIRPSSETESFSPFIFQLPATSGRRAGVAPMTLLRLRACPSLSLHRTAGTASGRGPSVRRDRSVRAPYSLPGLEPVPANHTHCGAKLGCRSVAAPYLRPYHTQLGGDRPFADRLQPLHKES